MGVSFSNSPRGNPVEPRETPVEPRKKQVGGTHYADMQVQPWEVMRSCFPKEGFAYFLQGNVIKYIMRSNAKGGVEDLKKAQHYLEELINLLESK